MSITGIIPPMVTPMTDSEEIDVPGIRREAELLLAAGVHGLSFAGSTGEGAVLDDREIATGVAAVQEVTAGSVPLLCGIIRDSTRAALSAAQAARDAGADALMVTPTHYYGSSEDGTVEFYDRIARLGLPVVVYNVVASNPVSPQLMVELARIPNVVGIKQSVGGANELADMLRVAGDRTSVYAAHDGLLMAEFLLGASGSISAILTVFPRLFVKLWDAVAAGEIRRAREIHDSVLPAWRLIEGRYFPARLKAALSLIGRDVGPARHPMIRPSEDELARLAEALEPHTKERT